MDIIKMKQDFYKRFGTSSSYLLNEHCGLLCTLLGFPHIKGALSLTYPLSMGVTGLCRSTGSNILQVESTDTNMLYTHHIKNNLGIIPAGQSLHGGQILFHNSVPKYFDTDIELKCCALKCFVHINDLVDYDKTAAAAACCGKENIKPYLALISAQKGYCIMSDRLKAENLPLPLSGFKLISIQFDKPRTNLYVDELEKEMKRIQNYYPHISAISDISENELRDIKHKIKDSLIYNRLKMIIRDNERIQNAARELKACKTSLLFDKMNESSKDLLCLWGLEKNEAMLIRSVFEIEGVRAVRFWNKGVIAVVYEERIDYVISSVEHSIANRSEYDAKFCISK